MSHLKRDIKYLESDMTNIDVNRLPQLDFEAGMVVEQTEEAVLCAITARIAAIIGVIF